MGGGSGNDGDGGFEVFSFQGYQEFCGRYDGVLGGVIK